MADWRHEFLAFCVDCDVLKFGDFTLKSGRSSPYFFNAGLFNTGERLSKLGGFYARRIKRLAPALAHSWPTVYVVSVAAAMPRWMFL